MISTLFSGFSGFFNDLCVLSVHSPSDIFKVFPLFYTVVKGLSGLKETDCTLNRHEVQTMLIVMGFLFCLLQHNFDLLTLCDLESKIPYCHAIVSQWTKHYRRWPKLYMSYVTQFTKVKLILWQNILLNI